MSVGTIPEMLCSTKIFLVLKYQRPQENIRGHRWKEHVHNQMHGKKSYSRHTCDFGGKLFSKTDNQPKHLKERTHHVLEFYFSTHICLFFI